MMLFCPDPVPTTSSCTNYIHGLQAMCFLTALWSYSLLILRRFTSFDSLWSFVYLRWPVLFSSLESMQPVSPSGYYTLHLFLQTLHLHMTLSYTMLSLDYLSEYSFVSYFEPNHAFLSEIVLICGIDAMLLSTRRHLVITLHSFHLGITPMMP